MSFKIFYNIDCKDKEIVNILKEFTEADLNNNLETNKIFDFFSNDAVLIVDGKEHGNNILSRFGFKLFCESNLVSIDSDPEVKIIDKIDHFVWNFSCDQTRRYKFLPEILSPAKKYHVEFESKIYFDEFFKINKFELMKSNFTCL